MFGFLGSLVLYSSLNKFEKNKLYVYLVLFLPNFHWWTSGIGKDAIICTTFLGALYFIVNRKFFSFFLVSLIVIGFLIRSHTVTMIIISLGMCYFLKPSEFPNVAKFFFPVILLVAIVFGAPIVANKVSIQSLDSVELIERMELQTERNLKGSTSFDISSYPPPLRLFTFMYRPLFLDASGAMGLMISFENAILLLLSFLAFRNLKIVYARDKQLPLEIVYCILVIALIWIMLGMTTANLGLAIRQKNQITPYIYYLFVISDYLKRRKV